MGCYGYQTMLQYSIHWKKSEMACHSYFVNVRCMAQEH